MGLTRQRRAAIATVAIVWSIGVAAIALSALGDVNADAIVGMTIVSIVLPLCGLMGGLAVLQQRDRTAIVLLVLSIGTPTYGAWVVSLVPVVLVVALLRLRSRGARAIR